MAEDLPEGISLTKKLRMSRDLASQIHEYADSRHITFSAAVRYLCASGLARVVEVADHAPALPEPPTRPTRALPDPPAAPTTGGSAPEECPECGRATDPVLETRALLINTAKRTWSCNCCSASGAY